MPLTLSNHEIISMSLVTVATLLIFFFGEILRTNLKIGTETTRKLAHITAGLVSLSFPFIFDSYLPVLVLAIGFFLFLTASKMLHFLNSINSIKRYSLGSFSYPIAVFTCFYFYLSGKDLVVYFLPMLIFIFCDPLAATVGIRTNWKPFTLIKDSKTVGGSLAFFASAFSLSLLEFSFGYEWNFITLLWSSIFMAAVTTLAEAASPWGLDNFFVPLSSIYVIQILCDLCH